MKIVGAATLEQAHKKYRKTIIRRYDFNVQHEISLFDGARGGGGQTPTTWEASTHMKKQDLGSDITTKPFWGKKPIYNYSLPAVESVRGWRFGRRGRVSWRWWWAVASSGWCEEEAPGGRCCPPAYRRRSGVAEKDACSWFSWSHLPILWRRGGGLRTFLCSSIRISTTIFWNFMSNMAATVSTWALISVGPKMTAMLEGVMRLSSLWLQTLWTDTEPETLGTARTSLWSTDQDGDAYVTKCLISISSIPRFFSGNL